jgi:Zn-dependent protease
MSSVPPPYGPLPPPPPPSPPEEPQGYQPFDSYYRPQPARPPQNARRGGLLGGLLAILAAAAAYGKYALLFLAKFGAVKTILTLGLSLLLYAQIWGPQFAIGLVVMILIHEMGHVVEIRRQGMQASAPLFIPFFGAAIFQRQHPTDALKQAQIGIAGPLAGTVAATAAFALFAATRWNFLLLWAGIGFFINLFNLIPVGMLDGGWIMAAVSKWFQVVGVVALLAVVVVYGVPWYWLILFALILGPGMWAAIRERFRNDQSPYYQSVPVPARLAMGAAWLFLAAYLGFALLQTADLVSRLR